MSSGKRFFLASRPRATVHRRDRVVAWRAQAARPCELSRFEISGEENAPKRRGVKYERVRGRGLAGGATSRCIAGSLDSTSPLGPFADASGHPASVLAAAARLCVRKCASRGARVRFDFGACVKTTRAEKRRVRRKKRCVRIKTRRVSQRDASIAHRPDFDAQRLLPGPRLLGAAYAERRLFSP